MFSWVEKALKMALSILPTKIILKYVLDFLRGLAAKTENQMDDAFVLFVEEALREWKLID